jgi:hypothetical protein
MDSGVLSLGRKVSSTAGSHEFWLHFLLVLQVKLTERRLELIPVRISGVARL